MQVFIDLRVIISVTLRYGSTTYEEYLPAQHAEVVNSAGQRSCRRGRRLFIVPVLLENHLHVIESMVGDGDVEILGNRQSAGAAELSLRGDGAKDRGEASSMVRIQLPFSMENISMQLQSLLTIKARPFLSTTTPEGHQLDFGLKYLLMVNKWAPSLIEGPERACCHTRQQSTFVRQRSSPQIEEI